MTYVATEGLIAGREPVSDNRPGLLRRLLDAMIESRRASVERELRAHHFLVSEADLVLGGFPRAKPAKAERLPFVR